MIKMIGVYQTHFGFFLLLKKENMLPSTAKLEENDSYYFTND